MSRFIQKIIYLAFSLFILYCAVWYGWGVYAKKMLHDALNSFDKYEVTTDKIELSGFPFNLSYTLRNLSIVDKGKDVQYTINLGNPILKSNFSLGSFVMEINDDISISTSNNKNNYVVSYNKGASLSTRLKNSIGYSMIQGNSKPLNIRDVSKFEYLDHGYSIKDTILEKVIFTSSKNDLDLKVTGDSLSDFTSISANFNGEGSEGFYIQGPLTLNASFDVKTIFDEKNLNRQIKGLVFNFGKFAFLAQGYSLDISGNLSVMGSDNDSTGVVAVKLNNVPKFLNTVEQFYSPKQTDYLKGLIFKMSGVAVDQPLENMDIEIKGENKDIKFGHATMVDLVLYSLRK